MTNPLAAFGIQNLYLLLFTLYSNLKTAAASAAINSAACAETLKISDRPELARHFRALELAGMVDGGTLTASGSYLVESMIAKAKSAGIDESAIAHNVIAGRHTLDYYRDELGTAPGEIIFEAFSAVG